VSKFRPNDGALLGALSPPGQTQSAWRPDGANIWITNQGGANTVTNLRARDGALLGTFPVGNNPVGVAFDGYSISGVANQGRNTVTRLRAQDGVNIGTFKVGSQLQFMAFDGANIWITNQASNNVTKLSACDGTPLGVLRSRKPSRRNRLRWSKRLSEQPARQHGFEAVNRYLGGLGPLLAMESTSGGRQACHQSRRYGHRAGVSDLRSKSLNAASISLS